jgi:hypothetical protein
LIEGRRFSPMQPILTFTLPRAFISIKGLTRGGVFAYE